MTDVREPGVLPATRIFSGPLRATTAGIVLVVTFVAFEVMAVATVLPTAVRELDGLAWYGWSFTAVLVASVVGMVTAGDIADRVGAARPLLLGLAAFAVGLLVAGAAPGMAVFVVGRGLQGVGIGLLIVAIYVLIGDLYPEALRPRVFAATSAAWVLPALVGPVVAGALAEHLSWRLVFLGLLPPFCAGSALLVPVLRRLPPRPERSAPPRPLRWRYALATAIGIAAVQYAGQDLRWTSLAPLAAGVLLLVVGLRTLLPAGTVGVRRGVPAVVAFRGMLAGSFFAVESLVPLTLTVVHGYSPTASGLPLMVGAFGWCAASWWQGRRQDVARHVLVRTGFALVAIAALAMAVVSLPTSPGWLAYPAWVIAGVGAGLVMPSIGVLLLALTPQQDRGANSAALQISDSVLSSICIGLGGALVAAAERGALTLSTAAGVLDLLMVALALAGAALAARARAPA